VIFGVGLSLAYLRFAAFDYLVSIGFAAGSFVLAALASSATKIANQWGRTIVLRLGQFQSMKGPGLIIPIVDSVPTGSICHGTDENVGYSTVGLRAAQTMHWEGMLVTPHVSDTWQHAFDDVTPDAALTFASTGIGFTVNGVPLAQDTALVDAGFDLALAPNATAGVSYSGQFGDRVQDNAVKGRFAWVF
jgi:hypothetical protein